MRNFDLIDSSIALVKQCIEKNNDSKYENKAEGFLPMGPQTIKDHNLNWERVYQSLIEELFGLTTGDKSEESIKTELISSFKNSRDTRELTEIIKEIYLGSNKLNKITPLAYLLCSQGTLSARTKTMINIARGLLTSPLQTQPSFNGNNSLETLLIDKLFQQADSIEFDKDRVTYLPFLAELFTKDIKALTQNSGYFLSEFETFIRLYTFLYLTQLTIQVCVADNRFKIPSSKRLYFILETERASRERHECNQYGYDYIFGSNRGVAQSLFPLIGYFSRIFNRPVWELRDVSCSEYLSKINEFNYELSKLFGEELNEEVSVIDAINSGGNFQKQIFEETLRFSKKGSRKTANKKVVDIFEKVFSGDFISDRKAAGKYFVLNSNVLLLITNLIIEQSANKKLLIDDVIEGFKERGIWLDLKSKRALLQFYENVGNIEKLSDSGDAVYVKSTI